MNNPLLRWCGNALIAFGVLMLACAVGVSVWPKSYAATVRLKIEKEVNGPQMDRGGFDPYWIQTEFEKIQSKVVLFTVITNLNLDNKWSRQSKKPVDVPSAYTMLKRMIDVRQARNTTLIEIEVRSHDPDEAATIANEVAIAFHEHKMRERRTATERSIKSLQEMWIEWNERARKLEMDIQQGTEESGAQKKRELEALQDDLRKLEHAIIKEKVDQGIPRQGVVEIIDSATPPKKPMFPSLLTVIGSWFLAVASIGAGILLRRS